MASHSTREQIIRELAWLRARREDESPEAKAIDTERAHARINRLLDQLEAEDHGHSSSSQEGWH